MSLLSAVLLCALSLSLAPSRVGEVVHRTERKLQQAALTVQTTVLGLPLKPGAPTNDPAAGAVLGAQKQVDDGSAIRQAFVAAAINERIRSLGYDPNGVLAAFAAYRSGDLARGDELSRGVTNAVLRAALDWTALHTPTGRVPLARFTSFAEHHADWPSRGWLRGQIEARLLRINDTKLVEAFFAANPPATNLGRLALARALKTDSRAAEAATLARSVFRESELPGSLEARLKPDFGADLTKADYKFRADRLLYKEQIGPALRYAAEAGSDEVALIKARQAIDANVPLDKALANVPPELRKDPILLLVEIQRLRRNDRLLEAANLMQTAPKEPALLVDSDEWWTERRILARRLLDAGNINAAYVICATHAPGSNETVVEAEFHAGWIALRFMSDPVRATYHFNQAAKIAETPNSVARIAYWQGRTAEIAGAPNSDETARAFYAKAAVHSETYYGQLAREMLGLSKERVREPSDEARGDARTEAVRVIELLYAAGEREAATALATEAANNLGDKAQIAALAHVVEEQKDAHLALTVGKLLGQRGLPVDGLAFPTFGIPHFEALQNSAPQPIVFAIARQESAFMPGVVSKAGAKGLMQIVDATAKRTANRAGVPFDSNRLVTDAAFNAQLGAAHLGELLSEQGGSLILTFAAYNAGGGHVKEWIDAYGDPRDPAVDPIDWIERIPFTETRNYVQRVLANATMYQAIFAEKDRSSGSFAESEGQARL